MKSKIVPIIIAAVVVIGAVIGYLVYSNNAYTGYAAAFSNSTKQTSIEYNTTLKVVMDGQTTKATGNMKIRDVTTKVNFVNVMYVDDITITQFTDGDYIYVDDGLNKQKFKIGDQPDTQPRGDDKGDFDMNYYIQEFSVLLDASKIKDLKINESFSQNIIEKITKDTSGQNTVYDVVLAAQLVNDIFNTVIDEQFADSASPKCKLNSFNYKAVANSSKLITSVTYNIDMDVTFPAQLTGSGSDSTNNMLLELTMDYVNPGQPCNFDLPSTSGF